MTPQDVPGGFVVGDDRHIGGVALVAGTAVAQIVDAQGAGRQRRAEAEVGIVRQLQDERRVHRPDLRSEEHTSDLQSPMRISYAAFCLKKQKPQLNSETT